MLSKYDNKKTIWYYTDDVSKFSNDISNKEHQIEILGNVNSNWLQELKINNKGDIVPSKIINNTNYKQSYYYFNNMTYKTICSGNRAGNSLKCNIFTFDDSYRIDYKGPEYGFIKVTILDT